MPEQILVEQRGRAGLIMLNRPEKLNAWTPRMFVEMREAIDGFVADPMIAAIVVTGAGRAFCAGADVSAVFAKDVERIEAGESQDRPTGGDGTVPTDWVEYLRTLPKPTIAAINGIAVGIGVTMVLPMDIRIISENAKMGMFFVRMGLVPELASSALLPQMVGTSRALDWCLTARQIPANELKEAGLVSEVVAPEQLIDRALALVDVLARNPSPAVVATRKLIIDQVHQDDTAVVQRAEGAALADARRTWEHKEAIAAFLEKREPDFTKQK